VTAEVEKYLEKAERSLQAANSLIAQDFFDEACSRSYYAMFYAAQALLKHHGIQVKKHSAVVAKIGEHFAKPGTLDKKYHRSLIDAREDRESVDYNVFSTINRETAEERLQAALEFIQEVKRLLGA
jgi:uncharacterized protein (UPF0332 family)